MLDYEVLVASSNRFVVSASLSAALLMHNEAEGLPRCSDMFVCTTGADVGLINRRFTSSEWVFHSCSCCGLRSSNNAAKVTTNPPAHIENWAFTAKEALISKAAPVVAKGSKAATTVSLNISQGMI